MPELPEVQCVLDTMSPRLVGRTASTVRVGVAKLARPGPKAFSRGIRGQKITRASRHGKLMILHLAGGGFWTIHLGMTGQIILAAQRPRADHIHITVSFADQGPNLYFRDMRMFGGMTYCPDEAALAAGPLKNMGPDALALAEGELAERLKGRKAPMKSLLLDQRVLAGVGNIYADEALFKAGISPVCRPMDLEPERLNTLHHIICDTLREAHAKGGSSVRNFVDAKGRAGTFQHAHQVYQRTGQPCPVCGSPVEKIVLAGRSTHYCPHCQKS